MGNIRLATTEPGDGSYLDLIAETYARIQPTAMIAAVAYATHSGVAELLDRLETLDGWSQVNKKWLVGIDFCRSDPVALEGLSSLPRSNVRIYDGRFVVSRDRCTPRISFHPKLYAFWRDNQKAIVAGSGNLSRTGLCVGVEAGMSICDTPVADAKAVHGWFDRNWDIAARFSDIAAEYDNRFQAMENRVYPIPTEDDAAPESASTRGQLTPAQL